MGAVVLFNNYPWVLNIFLHQYQKVMKMETIEKFTLSDGSEIIGCIEQAGTAAYFHRIEWGNITLAEIKLDTIDPNAVTLMMLVMKKAFKKLTPDDVDINFPLGNKFGMVNNHFILKCNSKVGSKLDFVKGSLLLSQEYWFPNTFLSSKKTNQAGSLINRIWTKFYLFKEDVKTVEQANMTLNPFYSIHGPVLRDAMKFFYPKTYYSSNPILNKLVQNTDGLLLLHQTYSALSSLDTSEDFNNTFVRDHPLVDVNKLDQRDKGLVKSITGLPLGTKKYREYVSNLTVGELKMILHKVPKNSKVSDAVAVSDKLIENVKIHTTNQTLDSALAIYQKIHTIDNNRVNHNKELLEIMNLCMASFLKVNTLEVLEEWVDGLDEKEFDIQYCLNAFRNFLKNNSLWLANFGHIDYACAMLREHFGSSDIVKLVSIVSAEKCQPFTVEQWKTIVKEFEVFDTTPVSWWKSLM